MYTCLFSLSTQCFNRIHFVFVKCFADPGMYSFFTNGADCILCVSMVMMACVCVFQRNMNNEETLELWVSHGRRAFQKAQFENDIIHKVRLASVQRIHCSCLNCRVISVAAVKHCSLLRYDGERIAVYIAFFFGLFPICGQCIKFSFSTLSVLVLRLCTPVSLLVFVVL